MSPAHFLLYEAIVPQLIYWQFKHSFHHSTMSSLRSTFALILLLSSAFAGVLADVNVGREVAVADGGDVADAAVVLDTPFDEGEEEMIEKGGRGGGRSRPSGSRPSRPSWSRRVFTPVMICWLMLLRQQQFH